MQAVQKSSKNIKALTVLLYQHRKFHKFLDSAVLQTKSNLDAELLINIRKFNLECSAKYTGLIANNNILTNLRTLNSHSKNVFRSNLPNGIWGIHRQLSLLARTYTTILKSNDLNTVQRTIVSNNHDQIINIIEDLLHPVQEKLLSLD